MEIHFSGWGAKPTKQANLPTNDKLYGQQRKRLFLTDNLAKAGGKSPPPPTPPKFSPLTRAEKRLQIYKFGLKVIVVCSLCISKNYSALKYIPVSLSYRLLLLVIADLLVRIHQQKYRYFVIMFFFLLI